MQIIDPKFLLQMYTKGYFPMAKSEESIDIEFFKPRKRFLIPISDFHIPKRLFKEFKKKNIILH
tara:strand:- start:23 stop:214 length:192 start_codon:yes stop_codon:yes gene_type:complete